MKGESIYYISKKIEYIRYHKRRQAEHLVLLTFRHSEKLIWLNHIRGLSKQAIADKLGKHYRSVHQTIRRIEEEMDTLERNLLKNDVFFKFCYDNKNIFKGDTV